MTIDKTISWIEFEIKSGSATKCDSKTKRNKKKLLTFLIIFYDVANHFFYSLNVDCIFGIHTCYK